MDTNATTVGDEDAGTPYNATVGLAVGIPCGIMILFLLVLITALLWFSTCKSGNEEEVWTVYTRKRFLGLSLEEQRKMTRMKKGMFTARRSSVAESKPSTAHLSPNTKLARGRKEKSCRLQDWQLTGIDATTDTTEGVMDSLATPVEAINPLLLQDADEESMPSYKPVAVRSLQARVLEVQPLPPVHPEAAGEFDGDSSSDSFNPYD